MSRTDRILTEISGKLERILRLLAVDVAKGIKREQEKIELLDSLGFRPIRTAELLNKSSDNVNVQLSINRKKARKPQHRSLKTWMKPRV